jgi:hypothetical protein
MPVLRCSFQTRSALRRDSKSSLSVGISRIASRSVEHRPSNGLVRQNRLKTVLVRLDADHARHSNSLTDKTIAVATAAGVSEIDAKPLMNHAIAGVNAGYITRHKLLQDHLRWQQQAISSAVFAALGNSLSEDQRVRRWVGLSATRRAIQDSPKQSAELERDAIRQAA